MWSIKVFLIGFVALAMTSSSSAFCPMLKSCSSTSVPGRRRYDDATSTTTRLLVASGGGFNETLSTTTNNNKNEPPLHSSPFETNPIAKTLDAILSSSATRIFLFLTPFLSSSSNHPKIETPILIACGATAAVILDIYQYRMDELNCKAIPARRQALANLKTLQIKQLMSGNVHLEDAIQEYKDALRNELQLRILIPHVWILPPASIPNDLEENLHAAKEFLHMEITDNAELVRIQKKD